MTIVTLGIDLGKTTCSLAGLDEAGRVVLRKRMRRDRLLAFTANLARSTVALEACCGAHHLGRRFLEQGHGVRLMPPAYVRRYVNAHKNDDRDAARAYAKNHIGQIIEDLPTDLKEWLDQTHIEAVVQRELDHRVEEGKLEAVESETGETIYPVRQPLMRRKSAPS